MSSPARDALDLHLQELRRGSVAYAVLLRLRRPGYGYGLLADLEEAGLAVDGNTLYPLLRRLEKQGLVASDWHTDDARPRKVHLITPEGESVLEELTRAWRDLDACIRLLDAPATTKAE